MVTRKKSEKEKTPLKIKASTGAWWKSGVSTESEAAVDKVAKEKTTAPPKKKAVPKSRKATPARRPKKVAKPVAKKENIENKENVEKAPEKQIESVATTEVVPAAKPKRAPRKRPVKKAVPAKDKKPVKKASPAKDKVSPVKDTLSEKEKKETGKNTIAESEQSDVSSPSVEKGAADVPVKAQRSPKKTGRSPRKRKPAKKKEPVAPSETGVADGEESAPEKPVVEAEATQVPEKETKQSGKGRGKTAEKPQKAAQTPKVKAARKLLINAEEPEETRIALLENGRLESIHVSSVTRTRTKNNIYKAKIVAIEPSLQAAFVDYGTDKNGFLPFSEIHPEYYKEGLSDKARKLVENHQWKKLSIADVVERGQEILAQVVKEEVGNKGANMTTYLSLPGRCTVLMPGSDSAGISRKIAGEAKRSQLREAMRSIDIPEGIGWIVRTASIDITKDDLSRDVGYLLRLWEDVKKKGQSLEGVGLTYEDHHNVLMFLREHFDPSIEEILVDDKIALDQVKGFIDLLPSGQQDVKVRLHRGSRPIFNQFSVEDQIESIYQPQVSLPSGGSIVIDPTEALVAIDVNSGSTSKGKNFEESIFQANLEAASELARQLRLRDLGGLIVVDFIDMRSRKHILTVEREVKSAMKGDKAKVDFSRISKFGLMEISRQKLGAPLEAGNYQRCEHCKGRGTIRTVETLALFYLRRIQTGASRKQVVRIECHFPLDVASYLLNQKRQELHSMETKYDVEVAIIAETAMKPADNDLIFHRAEKDVKK